MERPKPQEPTNSFEREQVLGNLLQLELAELVGEDVESFIDNKGEQVRVFLSNHPGFLDFFEGHKEEALQEVHKDLYH
ncbi:MAG: hypothetical protein RIQ41_58 [Candidatus Parcubacteria bacterium]|jgi:hypothetical protein